MGQGVARDPALMQKLVDNHYEAIYRFLYRLTGDVQDASDLTQETFCLAQERLDQLRDPDRARAWLYSIARNVLLQQRRRRNFPTLGDTAGVLATAENPPLSHDADEIDEERLQKALDQLPEEFRTPLVLYYFGDLSYKEIAEVMGTPVGTVMSRLSRAKDRLRKLLGLHVQSGNA